MSLVEEKLTCIECQHDYPLNEPRYTCECSGLLSVERNSDELSGITPELFDQRLASRRNFDRSGVWRFREAVLNVDDKDIMTHPEGGTNLYHRQGLCGWGGVKNLYFKHEGENPTGSFKDRGMTVAITQAKRLKVETVACASTGNTSAALAAYALQAGLKAVVFIPAGKIAIGKLAQALGYGATCLAVKGDFDDAMRLVQEASSKLGVYIVNSLNPFRIEGQKTIIWEILQDLSWQAPDWIVVPAGNLGNTSAFGKALREAYKAGWINKSPRIASIQASGANPFYQSYKEGFVRKHTVTANTIATAIQIGNPVNYSKAKRSIIETQGVVEQVTDEEIMAAKNQIDRSGIGCEPASATSLAGVKKLATNGVIKSTDHVVCILTGHILKDPDAITRQTEKGGLHLNEVEPELSAIEKFL